MRTKTFLYVAGTLAVGLGVLVTASRKPALAGQQTAPALRVGNADIGGVVRSSKGAEAGVWVIAETKELPTGFRKIVVTDDQGRYLVPGLPAANYSVWVRGYGLVDSPKVTGKPSQTLNLTAVVAPDAKAAAQYYPSNYWYSLLEIPSAAEFPGTGPSGNGITTQMTDQGMWIDMVKTNGCGACHQIGNKATREVPKELGPFANSVEAWDRRVQSGQDGAGMSSTLSRFGRQRILKAFADWTDRINAGEVPPAPPRPQGIERNIVITQWDWGKPTDYYHDEISTDKRNPRVNANGPIYGVHENASDAMTILDPGKNAWTQVPVPVRDPSTPYSTPRQVQASSAYWGDEIIWNSKANVHSNMMDAQGRLWNAHAIRPPTTPDFCGANSSIPSAKAFPIARGGKQLSVYDPKTQQFTLINTCFGTHHLQFAEDASNTLWFCGAADVVGWFNTSIWDKTHDEQKAQGWTAFVLDTNGNGKRDDYVEPNEPADPKKDKRISANLYGVVISPADGSVWGTVLGFPGYILRVNPGANPPATALAEKYELPWKNPAAKVQGFGPRGLDIDRDGVVWTVLSSGHLASFDRRKCKVTNGPTATGQHCAEGWSLYPTPGPNFKNLKQSGSADINYYSWVDQQDVLGFGKNTPIAIGNGADAMLVLSKQTGQFIVLRVPYPIGFFAKNMDARIDDPNAGWKGRGLWSAYAERTPWHIEGGKGTQSKVVKFQIRPNPLAD